ncbi:MAG: regulatory signaling modulator protein AmpE [Gammaproteobacteria bacterium]|nr:regulatory signaling modulator protein AmpE [Gammaproteobacteria bacterium]
MTLISIILGLLLDRRWNEFNQWRQFDWFSQLSKFVLEKTDAHLHNPTARYLAVLTLPVLTLLIIQDLIASWSVLAAFLFALTVFIYCLGSLKIEQQLEQVISHLKENENEQARSLILEISHESSVDDSNMIELTIRSAIHILIERLFGVIFWFVLLGPVGAVIYRLSQQLLSAYAQDPLISTTAERMLYLLNWLPERFLAISFAITGHFEGALAAFHDNKDTDRTQQHLLIDVCHGSLEGNERDNKAAYLNSFRGLLLRSLVVWLTSIALLTLFGWH